MMTPRQIPDHFAKHAHLAEGDARRVDLNFNLYPGEFSGVARLAQSYEPILSAHAEELYPPLSTKWLHSTILRAGLSRRFTSDQIQTFVDELTVRFADIDVPDLTIGHEPPEAKGDVILRIGPQEAVRAIHKAIAEVVGIAPNPDFLSHMSLAYSKARVDDGVLGEDLAAVAAEPVTFRPELWVVEQHVTDEGYIYKEPRIAEIPLGRSALNFAAKSIFSRT